MRSQDFFTPNKSFAQDNPKTTPRKTPQDYIRESISSVQLRSQQVGTTLQRYQKALVAAIKEGFKKFPSSTQMGSFSSQGPTLWEIITKPLRRRRR